MSFSTRRGRPKKLCIERDLGTPELIFKRLFATTKESIDICLERELITPEQHWCAIHLRWLHTLRYGAANVRTADPTHLGGRMLVAENPKWRAEREKELQEAAACLRKQGLLQSLLRLCVYNEQPKFLAARAVCLEQKNSIALSESYHAELASLRHGLEMLAQLWCRKKQAECI